MYLSATLPPAPLPCLIKVGSNSKEVLEATLCGVDSQSWLHFQNHQEMLLLN